MQKYLKNIVISVILIALTFSLNPKIALSKPGSVTNIRNVNHGKCLNLQKGMLVNGGLPDVFNCEGHIDQYWSISRITDVTIDGSLVSLYMIMRDGSKGSFCLTIEDSENFNGGRPKVTKNCNSSYSSIYWTITPVHSSGQFRIENTRTDKCLNLKAEDAFNGGKPTVWECNTHPDQFWTFDTPDFF